jgi:hypothetical protein
VIGACTVLPLFIGELEGVINLYQTATYDLTFWQKPSITMTIFPFSYYFEITIFPVLWKLLV